MPTRSPDEIRQSIEANRAELGMAVEKLRKEVAVVTDWRSQLLAHKKEVLIGAASAMTSQPMSKRTPSRASTTTAMPAVINPQHRRSFLPLPTCSRCGQ